MRPYKKICNVILFFALIVMMGQVNVCIAQTQWEKYSGNPVLSPGPSWEYSSVHTPTVIFDGNEYKMWYSGYRYSGEDGYYSYWSIGYATSTDGITWVRPLDHPVLERGNYCSEWDGFNVYSPTVIYNGTESPKYEMWYTGEQYPHQATGRIGYATSEDGINWVKYSGNPVLGYGGAGSWDSVHVEVPHVIREGSIYKMWYTGTSGYPGGSIGYATSADGITWQKDPSNPVLTIGASGSWDSYLVANPCVIFNGSIYEMWYYGSNSTLGLGNKIGYATSADGITWQKYPTPVLDIGTSGAWDSLGVHSPEVIYDTTKSPKYKMWYSGSNGSTTNIGYVTSIIPNQPPVIGSITAPLDPSAVNTNISVSADFTDPDIDDTHTAIWTWGDGSSSAGTVTEPSGNNAGVVSGTHAYTIAGVYTLTLTVTDNGGLSDDATYQYVVVYDPNGGFVTGGGWITSPLEAYVSDPTLTGKANFGFVSKYQKGANVPTGNTEFNFKVANLNFHSDAYDWLVIAGAKAQYKGTGTINGSGEYKFMLTAIDGQINGGGGVDKFRIKIWDKVTEAVVYDNQTGSGDNDDPNTVIGGGSIVIHQDDNKAPLQAFTPQPLPNVTCSFPAYPNPFNPDVWIPYQLSEDVDVVIRIYTFSGQLVRTLALGHKSAGFYTNQDKSAYWNGKNESGEQVSSGVYFYNIQAGNYSATKKMIVTK